MGVLIAGGVLGAPANDAFTSADVLAGALPLTIPAENVAASTEAGEPLRAGMGSTVWWNWTPVSTGWVRIRTLGDEDTHTVLAVHTGGDVGALLLVTSNEYGQVSGSTSGSGVLFQASAGQLYRIQAGGGANWQGSFSLSLEASAAPPSLTGLVFNPGTADITSEEQVVQMDATLADPAGILFVRLVAFRPDGTYHAFGYSEYTTLHTGTEFAGTYRASFYFLRYLPPGPWKIVVVGVGKSGVTAAYGEGTPLPAGVSAGFNMVNTGAIDASPPQLASQTLSPTTVDVTTSEKTVTVTTRLVDPLAGVGDFESGIELWDPEWYVFFDREPFSYRNRVAGHNADGTYQTTFTIPAGSPPGAYATALTLTDRNQNTIAFGVDAAGGWEPFPVGVPHVITVVNTGLIDQQPPSLVSVGIAGSPINVAEHGIAEIVVRVTDNRSGVNEVRMDRGSGWLIPLAGGDPIALKSSFKFVSGSGLDATYRAQFGLFTGTPPGAYRVAGITVADNLGYEATYGLASLGQVPYPTDVDPQVVVESRPRPGPYRDWLARYPALQDDSGARGADPDGDGFPNLAELALDMDPTKDSSPGGNDPKRGNAPVITQIGTRLQMTYKLSRANLGTDFRAITVAPQVSSDLITWSGTSVAILDVDSYRVSLTINASNPFRCLRLLVSDPAATLP